METQTHALSVTSSVFGAGERIPSSMVFNGMGCTGGNISPDLSWTGAPPGTKSYAVTMYDPDAPTTVGFWHWILFDVGAQETSIAAGAGKKHRQPHGSTLGFTDFGTSEYGGPCPPPGDPPHRYQINVFALDVEKLGVDDTTTGAKLMFMMRGHILAKGTLEGTYGR